LKDGFLQSQVAESHQFQLNELAMMTSLGGDLEHLTRFVKEIPLTGTALPGKGRSRSSISGPLQYCLNPLLNIRNSMEQLNKKGTKTQKSQWKFYCNRTRIFLSEKNF
jgi:hypothetical protein